MSLKTEPEVRPQKVDYSRPALAQQVRDLLARADLSQRQGARELGIDERTMRYWCAGDHEPPRMAILALERLVQMQREVREKPAGA